MKDIFANTINELGSHSCFMENDCEKYGMTWGCDEDCPVLNKGECKIYSSVEEYLEEEDKDLLEEINNN